MVTRHILAAAVVCGAFGAPFAHAADLPPYGYGVHREYSSEYLAPPPPTVIERRVVEAPVERRVVIERRVEAPPVVERRVVVEHEAPPPIVERRVVVDRPIPPAPVPHVYERTVVVDRPALPVGGYVDDDDED